jgi:hypothetical protein
VTYSIDQFERGNLITVKGADQGYWKIVLGAPHWVLLHTESARLMEFDPAKHEVLDFTSGSIIGEI